MLRPWTGDTTKGRAAGVICTGLVESEVELLLLVACDVYDAMTTKREYRSWRAASTGGRPVGSGPGCPPARVVAALTTKEGVE